MTDHDYQEFQKRYEKLPTVTLNVCPFCGSRNAHVTATRHPAGRGHECISYSAECSGCRGYVGAFGSANEAKQAWNTRVTVCWYEQQDYPAWKTDCHDGFSVFPDTPQDGDQCMICDRTVRIRLEDGEKLEQFESLTKTKKQRGNSECGCLVLILLFFLTVHQCSVAEDVRYIKADVHNLAKQRESE